MCMCILCSHGPRCLIQINRWMDGINCSNGFMPRYLLISLDISLVIAPLHVFVYLCGFSHVKCFVSALVVRHLHWPLVIPAIFY